MQFVDEVSSIGRLAPDLTVSGPDQNLRSQPPMTLKQPPIVSCGEQKKSQEIKNKKAQSLSQGDSYWLSLSSSGVTAPQWRRGHSWFHQPRQLAHYFSLLCFLLTIVILLLTLC
ncbi:lactose-binding lectin l-2-like protein, partial [Lates japonicus]